MENSKNELRVKYHNDLNTIVTTEFSETDLNVFFALCAKAKGKNTNKIRIDFDTFFEIAGLRNKTAVNTRKKKINFIDEKFEVLEDIKFKAKTDSSLHKFRMITELDVEDGQDVIVLGITDRFLRILNTDNSFTSFVLTDFVGIKGKYPKNLYRLLMRFENTGWADYTIEDFKDFMGIPAGYRPKDVIVKIINPSIDELVNKGLLAEIRYDTKRSHRQGNEIKGFHFEFKKCVNDEVPGQTDLSDGSRAMMQYKEKKAKERQNAFNNFPQNSYDFAELEEKLLDN